MNVRFSLSRRPFISKRVLFVYYLPVCECTRDFIASAGALVHSFARCNEICKSNYTKCAIARERVRCWEIHRHTGCGPFAACLHTALRACDWVTGAHPHTGPALPQHLARSFNTFLDMHANVSPDGLAKQLVCLLSGWEIYATGSKCCCNLHLNWLSFDNNTNSLAFCFFKLKPLQKRDLLVFSHTQ